MPGVGLMIEGWSTNPLDGADVARFPRDATRFSLCALVPSGRVRALRRKRATDLSPGYSVSISVGGGDRACFAGSGMSNQAKTASTNPWDRLQAFRRRLGSSWHRRYPCSANIASRSLKVFRAGFRRWEPTSAWISRMLAGPAALQYRFHKQSRMASLRRSSRPARLDACRPRRRVRIA